jgi:hypothetical protein
VSARLAGVVGLVIVVGGCGSSAPDDQCGQVQPCGGDIRGTWKTAGSCINPPEVLSKITAPLGLMCPAGSAPSLARSSSNRSLSSTFNDDGTFDGTSVLTGTLVVDVPASCLGGGACADLQAALQPLVSPSTGFIAATCTGTATCTCDITNGGISHMTGTYTTSGSVLEITSGGAVTDTDYCVSGSFLHFINLDGSTVITDSLQARQ